MSPISDAKTNERFLNREVLQRTSPELTRLVSGKDWASTPLGPIEQWPPALRTLVQELLGNGFGLLLWWGPQFCQIYNDAYRPVLGTKHPAALGQPASECFAEIWDIIGPMIEQPYRTGRPSTVEDLHVEINRHGFLEETHFTVAYSPVFDEECEAGIGGVLATVHEITEQVIGERRLRLLSELGVKTAEAKTAEEAAQIAADILESDPRDVPFAFIYLIEANGKIARLAAVSGCESNDTLLAEIDLSDESAAIIAKMISSGRSIPVDDFGDAAPAIAVPIRSTVAHQMAGFLIAGTSPRLAFDDSYSRFFDLMSAPIATAITNARAYEEERRRAEALAEIDRSKNIFFSNVSHEFRTPLQLMLGPLDELTKFDDENVRDLAHSARRNSLRLLKLVNTLLQFSRLESGRADASFVESNLATITRDLASVFRSAIESAGLQFEVDVTLDERVFVDRSMWERIVLNLLSNALKFTLEGSIALRLHRSGQNAELVVSDTGSGVPASELPHLFERFHRVHGAKSRSIEGSGIGLALVHDLVALHGGTIAVESDLGKGTTFRVSIPLGRAHLNAENVITSEDSVPHQSSVEQYLAEVASTMSDPADKPLASAAPGDTGSRILVVDDNADLRDYVTRLLASHYRVVSARNGVEALAAARAARFDLIISDVMMPEMDGFELLRALRADERLRTTSFIMLSARAGEESAIEGFAAGADDYLSKPFSAEELFARVAANLRAASVRDATERALRELAEAIPVIVWTASSDGWIDWYNSGWYEYTGQTHEEAAGWGWQAAHHPDDFQRVMEEWSRSVASGEPFRNGVSPAARRRRISHVSYAHSADA